MKHIYFVRHGLSVMNEKGIFSGRSETILSPKGIIQAEQVGRQLKNYQIDYIIASPSQRTKQTAKIISKQINFKINKIVYNELLLERDYGLLEGKPYIAGLKDYDGIETIEDLITRASKAWLILKTIPADNILVISHGAIGRALRHVINPKIPFYNSTKLNNAEIIQLI